MKRVRLLNNVSLNLVRSQDHGPTFDDQPAEGSNRSFRSMNRLTKELMNKDKKLEEYNEELLAVERAKEEFMSMINHELKTPLVPIKGYADMLLKPNIMGELNEKQKKAVGSISYNVGKLELLISDILDVYKLDMGKLSLAKKDVEVEYMIISNMIEFKPLADQKNVKIKADIQYNGSVFCMHIQSQNSLNF